MPLHVEFGYLPIAHDFSVVDVTVSTLPDLLEKRSRTEASKGVESDWIYAPPMVSIDFCELPYPSS